MSMLRSPTSPTPTPTPTPSTWDCMLPGPPSRSNASSASLSATSLLAYGSGSSISVVDTISMQLISTIPLPPPPSSSSSPSLSPFVTSIKWAPQSLPHHILDDLPNHLLLAVGDRQGRICLVDFRSKSPILFFQTDNNNNNNNNISNSNSAKFGIQDLCWVQVRSETWILAALSGSSILSLYNVVNGRCLFKYDASPEYFSCVRGDPFDSRRFYGLGLKGFLISVKCYGDESENDVVLKELQVPTDSTELQKLERDRDGSSGSGVPASATFPMYIAKFAFSPHSRNIMYVVFPRELIVFDLQYEKVLFSVGLPRRCGKFLEVLPDSNLEGVVYCAHLDGKITVWRRKGGDQVHLMCMMDDLMPSIGTSVPSPSILSVVISQSDAIFQTIGNLCSDSLHAPPLDADFDNPFDFHDESLIISKTHLLSISDDGKVWKWLLSMEGREDTENDTKFLASTTEVTTKVESDVNAGAEVLPAENPASSTISSSNDSKKNSKPNTITEEEDVSFKICLVGQVQFLSSTVTMLAVPSPSLTATLARGGNYPAVAVPLVALGTQSGTIEVIDVSANAVSASYSVHNGVLRGLRWLGNSRLVSFSYTQGSDRSGGYINKLVVTCLRSGLNRTFRVLQKPERAPIRALRASSSGRYLLILFRDAPVEVWAMTKTPVLLRSLALPFTVVEWTLPTVPRPLPKEPARSLSFMSKERSVMPPTAPPSPMTTVADSKGSADGSQDEFSESFSFALVNGALGVFEVHGRRIRDFRPKWPSSSFVPSDGVVTAMAYRLPHVVMGDRSGNIRWWDVTTGQSSSFNTHREGIRRIKFSPVVPGDLSRGRVAVLFHDNTFAVYDLDCPDPLANSLLQPQFPGTLVLELDWLPLRTDKNDPLVLCLAGADSSFRLVEVIISDNKVGYGAQARSVKERFRPVPVCLPILLPIPHALALQMILQLGVKPSWFSSSSTTVDNLSNQISSTPSAGDLRGYMIESLSAADSVVAEMLLKVLEPYRREGCILDDDRARQYANIVNRGSAMRFAFAAALFGDFMEALFWIQLPNALKHFMNRLMSKSNQKSQKTASSEFDEAAMMIRISSKGKSAVGTRKDRALGNGQLGLMAFEQEELWGSASECIHWHEKLETEDAIQNRVHELVSVGNLDGAVSLLLSTSPESSYFYPNALRAVALSSAVSRSLHELAVKVVAANMVRSDNTLFGTHLLCAVGRHQEACSQLQDAGCWTDAATLAATHLKGSDYERVLQRWAGYVLRNEHNMWRALVLYVAAGALQEALAAIRQAQRPDTAAMFITACRQIRDEYISSLEIDEESNLEFMDSITNLPVLHPDNEDVIAVAEYYGQYQRKLIHMCMDSQPVTD